MEKKVCKFSVQEILPIAMTIIVIGLGLSFGLNIMSDVKSDFTDTSSAEYNATVDTINAVSKFSDKLGIIVTVVIAAILIGILTRYLMIR